MVILFLGALIGSLGEGASWRAAEMLKLIFSYVKYLFATTTNNYPASHATHRQAAVTTAAARRVDARRVEVQGVGVARRVGSA